MLQIFENVAYKPRNESLTFFKVFKKIQMMCLTYFQKFATYNLEFIPVSVVDKFGLDFLLRVGRVKLISFHYYI